jgi:hypothetical protein
MESKLLHGKVISLEEFRALSLCRENYLNFEDIKKTEVSISKNEPLLFLPSYSYEQSMFRSGSYGGGASYKLIMIGILKDGRKATVVIEDIYPFFEFMATKEKYIESAKALIARLRNEQIEPKQQSVTDAKPLIGYCHSAMKCVRFYFKDLKQREKALNIAAELNLETYTDQKSGYYQVPCRQYDFSLSKWCVLENYEQTTSYHHNLSGRVFRISVNNIKRCKEETVELMRDKSVSVMWDIETYSPDFRVPDPCNMKDKMFMLAATVHWTTYKESLLRVVFSEFPTASHPDFLTVVCGSEIGIFRGFIKLIASLKPDGTDNKIHCLQNPE